MNAMTRRGALRGVGLIALAGIAAKATPANAAQDADLIRACVELIAMQAELTALYDRRLTIEDEQRTEPEVDILIARAKEAEDRLSALPPPSTLAGVRAMSRMAVARWHLDNGDELWAEDFDEWVSLSIIEYLAGDATT